MENKRERMQRILSQFEKKLELKDLNGEVFEIVIKYPSIRNSEEFWDVIHTVVQNNQGNTEDMTPEQQIVLVKSIVPKIIAYILKGYERDGVISEEEKEGYSALIYTNIESVMHAFLTMANRMLGTGGSDAPKNIAAAVLQTESSTQ